MPTRRLLRHLCVLLAGFGACAVPGSLLVNPDHGGWIVLAGGLAAILVGLVGAWRIQRRRDRTLW